eukprot:gene8177-1433_t
MVQPVRSYSYGSGADRTASDAAAAALSSNEAFKNVFAESLARSGGMGKITEGEAVPEHSNMEVALSNALLSCKQSYGRLVAMQRDLDASIERETKQFERLQFTYEKLHLADDIPFKCPQLHLADDIPFKYPQLHLADDIPFTYPQLHLADDIPFKYPQLHLADDIPFKYPQLHLADDIPFKYPQLHLADDIPF